MPLHDPTWKFGSVLVKVGDEDWHVMVVIDRGTAVTLETLDGNDHGKWYEGVFNWVVGHESWKAIDEG